MRSLQRGQDNTLTADQVLQAWAGLRVLVLGGTGFLGHHLVQRLQDLGAAVTAWGRANCDLVVQEPHFGEQHYDYIFFLAAFQGGGTFAADKQADIYRINSAMTLHALETWRKQQPRAKFISVGSSCAYPTMARPMTEEDFWAGDLHESVIGYGFAKRTLQIVQQMYQCQYGLCASHFILSTLFGEYDRFDSDRAHVVAALIARFVAGQRDELDKVEIWGNGSQIREFFYVGGQVTRLLLASLLVESDLLNIGSGQATTIRELAETIAIVCGFEGELFFNPARYAGNPYKVLDSSAAQHILPTHPVLTLEEALRRTVAWYRKEHL